MGQHFRRLFHKQFTGYKAVVGLLNGVGFANASDMQTNEWQSYGM